jgi:hypothetical protein
MDIAAPHAMLFGALVAWGELAIGIGTLLGFLFRPAAFCGGLLSLIFFLSASWSVRPYFYGADIVFLFGWMTLSLAGPAGTGLPALDTWLWPWWRGELAAPPRAVTQARALGDARQGRRAGSCSVARQPESSARWRYSSSARVCVAPTMTRERENRDQMKRGKQWPLHRQSWSRLQQPRNPPPPSCPQLRPPAVYRRRPSSQPRPVHSRRDW